VQQGRALRQSRQMASTLALDRGLNLCEQNSMRVGLLWLLRALEIAPADDQNLQRVIRSNVTAWGQLDCPLRALFPVGRGVTALAFSADGSHLAAACTEATVWDTATDSPRGTSMSHPMPVQTLAFSPDGSHLATGGFDRCARLWDVRTAKPQNIMLRHEGPV